MLIKRQFLFAVFVTFTFAAGSSIRDLAVDIGRNLTVPCPLLNTQNVLWLRCGQDQHISRHLVQEDGSLFLFEVDRNDSGLYTCSQESSDAKATVKVRVRTPPPPLDVSVHPSTVVALLMWNVNDTGGYPITYFTAQYRAAESEEQWRSVAPSKIGPGSRQAEVLKLEPNTSYAFRVWATNLLGKGDVAEVEGRTHRNHQEIELARHLLQGAEKFDTGMWFVAVAVVMSTLVLLGVGTCLLLYQECRQPRAMDSQEVIELVPNIILNPGFDEPARTERIPADENSNSETAVRLNNNTVVQPRNV